MENKTALPVSIFLAALLPARAVQRDMIVSPSVTLPVVANVRLPATRQVYRGRGGRDWVFLPYREEHSRHNFPLPSRTIYKIKTLIEHGVEFDDLWLAHEVYNGSESWMPTPSEMGIQESQWASHLLDNMTMPHVTISELLDPILFGCNHNDDGTSTLYVIDMWEW